MPYASESANYILYTPFDSKSVGEKDVTSKLTPDEFLAKCYAEPQFKKRVTKQKKDCNFEVYDYIINYNEIIDLHDRQKKDYKNFLKWMSNKNNSKIYTISGNAGTGKTTFIRRLEFENRDRNWIICDITKSRDFIEWFNGITTDIDNFNIPYNKMLTSVLEHLCKLLFSNANENTKTAAKHLKKILKAYIKKFDGHFIRGGEYFEGLINSTRISYLFKKYDAVLNKAAQYTKNFFDNQKEKFEKSPKFIFRISLDILLIASSCVNNRKDHVIVFDNLERFIAHDEIYNSDLDQIRRDLSSYSKEINEKNNYYQCNFKFIMGIRTSSNRMCGVKLHSADELPSDLNITGWFLIDDIISLKLKWYKEIGAEMYDVKIVSQIICDLRTCIKYELTGLQLFIHPLFNDNIRLITDFIGIIIEKASNKELINKYIELWNEDTPVSRFAARSIIRSLIYQELDNYDNLFHNLQLYTEIERKKIDKNDNDYGLSYVRKILTILYNNGKYVPLEQIIAKLCNIREGVQEYWNKFIPDKNKDNISKVLFYMNSYNRRENDWVQFIDIQITGMSKSVSIDDFQTLKELINQNMSSISLRIMPSGEAYIRYIVSSFEFFSYRFFKKHVKKYQPLFSVVPTLEVINSCNDIKKLPCYKILEYVKDDALGCIDNIKKNGDIEVYLFKNSVGKKHAKRIIDLHKGFIDQFVYYLRQKYDKDVKTNDNLKNLIEECINIKGEYKI